MLNLGSTTSLHMCAPSGFPSLIKYFWIPIIVSDGMVVVLVLAKAVRRPEGYEDLKNGLLNLVIGDATVGRFVGDMRSPWS